MSPQQIRIGTRGSDLALWQANYISSLLQQPPEIVIIKTSGDRIQDLTLDKVEGKGFFTKEIEAALLEGQVDLAIHSYKDLPTEDVAGLYIAAVPQRAPVRDVMVRNAKRSDPSMLWQLPKGATVGTSSLRRKAQILSCRPDLQLVDIRGNVPTRLGRAASGELDAVVLAEAGLRRLGLWDAASEKGVVMSPIEVKEVCPAPAQGALAVQLRVGDAATAAAVAHFHDSEIASAVDVERDLLSIFGGGCHLPLGAYCEKKAGRFSLRALVAAPDGSQRIESLLDDEDPKRLVARVHEALVSQGAQAYL